MLGCGPVISRGGVFIQSRQGDELRAAFDNIVADAVEVLPGIAFAQVADQHHHGALGRGDEGFAVPQRTGDIGASAQLDAHEGRHRVVHEAAEIHHLRIKNHQPGIQRGHFGENTRHHRTVDDAVQHGTTFIHCKDYFPWMIPHNPSIKPDFFKDQLLVLHIVVGKVITDGALDVQIPDGTYIAAAVTIHLTQRRPPNFLPELFRQLRHHFFHDATGGVQHGAFHQVLQFQHHFQQILVRFHGFQHFPVCQQFRQLVTLQSVAL